MDTRIALIVVLLLPGLAGCLAPSAGPGSSGPASPTDDVNDSEDTAADPTTRTGPGNDSLLGAPMVWTLVGGGFYRIDPAGADPTPLDWGADVGPISMRWGPDGALYGLSPDGTVRRIDPANGTVELLFESSALETPIALTILGDGRFAILDVAGGVTSPEGTLRAGTTRVVLLDRDGTIANVWTDPRFSGTVPRLNWGDIATGPDGQIHVVTGNSDHNRTTPADPSDDDGTGAVWRIDPAGTSPPELLASHARFRFPDGIDVGADGTVYVVEWVADDPEVYRIADGTTEVIAVLEGANRLWLPEILPDGRLAVIGAGGPVDGPDDPESPGGLWVVDPATGAADHVATIPEADGAFGPARVWS